MNLLLVLMMVSAAQPGSASEQYESYFLGTYAEGGACAVPERTWVFRQTEMAVGELACEIKSADASKDGAVRLHTRSCTVKGADVPAPTFSLDLRSEEVISASDGKRRVMLWRCPI